MNFSLEFIPYDFPWMVLHTISIISFHLWCMLGSSVLNLDEEQPISVNWGPNSSSHVLACQNDPQWTNMEYYLFNPPYYLQSCTQKITQHWMCCMQNNQLPTKSHVKLHNIYIILIKNNGRKSIRVPCRWCRWSSSFLLLGQGARSGTLTRLRGPCWQVHFVIILVFWMYAFWILVVCQW